MHSRPLLFAKVMRWLALCVLALGVHARAMPNVPLEKLTVESTVCTLAQGAQVLDTPGENASLYGECVSGTTINPYKYVDPDGRDSYLVSRPLDNAIAGCCASHNFVVSNATSIGDPKATVYSWGNKGDGHTGKVTESTTGMSKTTAATDKSFWSSLAKDEKSASKNTTLIKAPDATVDQKANGVQGNTTYSLMPSSSPRLNETNSNSAASAVANSDQGSKVEVPGGARISTGTEQAKKIQIVDPK